MQKILIALLMCAALAGCASDSSNATPNSDPQENDDPGGNVTTPGGTSENGTNQLPVITLEALQLEAIAPSTITFNITITDADGDAITWSFDANGDGQAEVSNESLPASIDFAYDGAGTYNATVVASDSTENVTAILAITILPRPGDDNANAGLPPPRLYPGTALVPDPFALLEDSCVMALADFADTGAWGDVIDVDGSMAKWKFFMDVPEALVTFASSDGGTIGGSGNSGTVGAGMGMGITCASAPDIDYVLTIHHPDWQF